MASFVVDWSFPSTCTSQIRLSKKVMALKGEIPLMHNDLTKIFKLVKEEMKVILQDKTRWSGTKESKWCKVIQARKFTVSYFFK